MPRDLSTYDGSEYRGGCFGCGWRGPLRDDENSATEDAHDHAFSEWRDLPAIEPYRYDDDAKRARLAQRLAGLYPVYWRERHGPTITYRDIVATRHVPGGGLFGGYCMARVRHRDERESGCTEQLDLFTI